MRKRKAQALVAAGHVRRASKPKAKGATTAARPLATMRDVRGAVADHPDGTEIQAALDRWEKLKGPLEDIPADAREVRRLLKKVDPKRDGIQHRVWGRTKKRIGDALRHCRLERMPARSEVPLTSEWKTLLASVPKRPYQVAIERFARRCSMREHGLSPHAVRAQDFDRFGDDLTETTRKDLVRNVYLRLCNAWNEAVDAFPHWPRVRPAHTLRRLWYTRDWDDYPNTLLFEIDRLFEARRTCGSDSLSPWRAPIGPEAERTQRAYLSAATSSQRR